ncbi:MAG: hypothetical protein ACUVS4_15615 [Chloroflexaceae bacterium]
MTLDKDDKHALAADYFWLGVVNEVAGDSNARLDWERGIDQLPNDPRLSILYAFVLCSMSARIEPLRRPALIFCFRPRW